MSKIIAGGSMILRRVRQRPELPGKERSSCLDERRRSINEDDAEQPSRGGSMIYPARGKERAGTLSQQSSEVRFDDVSNSTTVDNEAIPMAYTGRLHYLLDDEWANAFIKLNHSKLTLFYSKDHDVIVAGPIELAGAKIRKCKLTDGYSNGIEVRTVASSRASRRLVLSAKNKSKRSFWIDKFNHAAVEGLRSKEKERKELRRSKRLSSSRDAAIIEENGAKARSSKNVNTKKGSARKSKSLSKRKSSSPKKVDLHESECDELLPGQGSGSEAMQEDGKDTAAVPKLVEFKKDSYSCITQSGQIVNKYPRLLCIHGASKEIGVRSVIPNVASLNQEDVFILDNDSQVYTWIGPFASAWKRHDAARLTRLIDEQRSFSTTNAMVTLEGTDIASNEFWKLLGKRPVLGDIAIAAPEEKEEWQTVLYLVRPEGFEEVSRGRLIQRSILQSAGVYILDLSFEVYLWLGHDANQDRFSPEQLVSSYAGQYIKMKENAAKGMHLTPRGVVVSSNKPQMPASEESGPVHVHLIRQGDPHPVFLSHLL